MAQPIVDPERMLGRRFRRYDREFKHAFAKPTPTPRFSWAFSGLVSVGTMSPLGSLGVGYPGRVVRVGASLGTVDSANPVEIGFYINGTQFTTVDIPTTNTWVASTLVMPGHFVIPTTGLSANQYAATTPGETGTVEPTWPTTVGTEVQDNFQFWQTVGLNVSYARSPSATSWIFPGNHDDYLSAEVLTYAGSTAANLTVYMESTAGNQ